METRAELERALREGPREPHPLPLDKPIAVYGAGSCGRSIARALQASGHDVLGFVDRAAREGVLVDGRKCLSPQEAVAWRDAGAVVVVALQNPNAPQDEAARDLASAGWPDVRSLLDAREVLGAALDDQFWLGRRVIYRDAAVQERILAAFDLWSDDLSRRLFALAIRARLSGEIAALNEAARHDVGPQYFPRDVQGWPTPRRVVDGGAFDGDTLRSLPWSEIEAVAAFEPDTASFAKLAAWCRQATPSGTGQPQAGPPVALWPCGLWHETTALRFNAGAGTSSRVSDAGGEVVSVVALDEALHGWAPDFIKLDIEGAEPNALAGARRLIEEHRPALAVCVYHRPEHLWDIPLQVAAMCAHRKYFLRAHRANGFEWVLYAAP